MTFARYGLLKNLTPFPWHVAAVANRGIALFEYLLKVSANRIGHRVLDFGQLKIIYDAVM